MKKVIAFIKENKWAQFLLVLLAGVAIGAVFYPTKHIEETIEQEYQTKIQKITEEKEKLTKELTEKINSVTKEKNELQIDSVKKVAELTYQIRELQSKQKETFYKIVHPDGTIEVKKYKESEVNETTTIISEIKEEFTQKITEIENRWKTVHQERVIKIQQDFDKRETLYKDEIAKLKKETIIDINPKKFGTEIGYLINTTYYLHNNIDVFGPIFIGIHSQTDLKKDFTFGGGVGIRW